MPGLQVREIREDLYRRLVEDAEREHRSVAQQAVVTIAKGLGVDESPTARRRRLLERIHSRRRTALGQQWADPVALVREDRER